jgi:hypothetical protein
VNNTVSALFVAGTNLYAGGDFTTAGEKPAAYIARWNTLELLPPLPPEDLYGHGLKIVTNQNVYFVENYSFTNLLTIFNGSTTTSRTGYVAILYTNSAYASQSRTDLFAVPALASGSFFQSEVGGDGVFNPGDFSTCRVYATLFEAASPVNPDPAPQAQDSRQIFEFYGTAPPSGGVPSGGSTLPAPGFTPPPTLTNTIVIGPTLVEENSLADYFATAYFNNGTTNTNMSPTWSSSGFTISSLGRFSAGNVSNDTPVNIRGTITYGSATNSGNLAATVVDVRGASLRALSNANNQLRLQLSGTTGRRYALEARTNLGAGNWFDIGTNQILSNSVLQLSDPSATNDFRAYRTRLLP